MHVNSSDGFSLFIGVDEAGRGPLAGPVVAGAVALKDSNFKSKITDSKRLSEKQREEAFKEIYKKAYVGIGIISESVIDQENILIATYFAMANAVRQLVEQLPKEMTSKEDFKESVCLLIDGLYFETDLPYTYKTIVHGDSLDLSIACASIVAKVTRDRILLTYDQIFPQYGFRYHKGYPTLEHKRAIKEHGLSMIHRKSYNYR